MSFFNKLGPCTFRTGCLTHLLKTMDQLIHQVEEEGLNQKRSVLISTVATVVMDPGVNSITDVEFVESMVMECITVVRWLSKMVITITIQILDISVTIEIKVNVGMGPGSDTTMDRSGEGSRKRKTEF